MSKRDIIALAMVREWPVRSMVTIVVPLLFSVGQVANSYYHNIPLVYSGVFAVLFAGITVLATQRQYAAFRADRLQSRYTDEKW